jgi:hypothetical protein
MTGDGPAQVHREERGSGGATTSRRGPTGITTTASSVGLSSCPCPSGARSGWRKSKDAVYFDGYATVEPSGSGFDWVCRQCFDDFGDELEFLVVGDGPREAS